MPIASDSKILSYSSNRPKLLFILTLVFAIVVGLASYFKDDGIRSLIDKDKTLALQRQKIQRLDVDNDSLRRRIKSVHDDSRLVEEFAREKLTLVKRDEIVFRFYDSSNRDF